VLGQSRQHRQQLLVERERWREDMRRDAYHAYIAAAKQLSAAWWRAYNKLMDSAGPTDWQASFTEAHDAWVEFSTAAAAVAIAGPREVVDAADELRRAMTMWEDVGMTWIRAAMRDGNGRLDEFVDRFETAAEAKRIPDRAFQAAARAALGTEA